MSYNLLFNTSLINNNTKAWKLKNCTYENGYLIASKSNIYALSLDIILAKNTRLYASFDCVSIDGNISSVTVGILLNGVLHSYKKTPKLGKRKRYSVVQDVTSDKITVMLIIEAKTPDTRLFIDCPMLVDLEAVHKVCWPKSLLNTVLDYRYGSTYTNKYSECEITTNNLDFVSTQSKVEKANTGVLVTLDKAKLGYDKDWFNISCKFKLDTLYLVKMDYAEVNDCGEIYLNYGEYFSSKLSPTLDFLLLKGTASGRLRIYLENKSELPYSVNIKHLLIVDLTNLLITEYDIPHLPFV